MKVELINTGTELLLGDVVNTNAAWLGRRLVELGLRVERSTCVPDGDAIRVALEEACRRADVVIVTGGLGPTSDDISREVTAEFFGLPLELNDEVMRGLERRFARIGKPVGPHNRRQAMVPRGAEVLPNPNGTAPGLFFHPSLGASKSVNCAVILLPGPPRELQPMMMQEAESRLRRLMPHETPRECRYFKFTGLGESEVSMALQDGLEAIPGLEIGYCLGKGDVDVRLTGPVEALEKADVLCRAKLGEFLVSDDRRLIEEVVVHLLTEKKQWVATAESCTGGFVANRITNISGASHVFAHGFVTYANEAKTRHLGVPAELIAQHGAVSAPVAAAMAEGCLRVSDADHALAVTGIAGPGGGSVEKPVGTVFIALASREGGGTEVRRRLFSGDRERFKILASQTALDFLRRRLCDFPISE
jgi:competence/damage-inducible protein CinA-like protein